MQNLNYREFLKVLAKAWDTVVLLLIATGVFLLNRFDQIDDQDIPIWILGILCAFFIHLIIDRANADKVDENVIRQLSNHTAEIEEVISGSLSNDFQTHQKELTPFRAFWNHYHVTVIEGIPCWIHTPLDFSENNIVGCLSTRTSIKIQDGNSVWYNVKVGLRTDRLIVFFTPERSESMWIEIYPYADTGISDTLSGFGFLQNWNKRQQLGQCLMTRTALHENSSKDERGVLNQQASIAIDQKWMKELADGNFMLFPSDQHWGYTCKKNKTSQSRT